MKSYPKKWEIKNSSKMSLQRENNMIDGVKKFLATLKNFKYLCFE